MLEIKNTIPIEVGNLALLLIFQGNPGKAETQLLWLHYDKGSDGRNGIQIEILILLAVTYAVRKHGEKNVSLLEQASRLAKGEGFVQMYMDEGPPMVELLSERELQVLHRLAAGYSNQEIAQELVLAVSTVKKHLNNIYGKLEVGSRTQAVAKARSFSLL